jgi:hypothetical protein
MRGGDGTSIMNVAMSRRNETESPVKKGKRSIEGDLDRALAALTNLELSIKEDKCNSNNYKDDI